MKKTALGIALAITTLLSSSALAQNGKAAKAPAVAKAAKPKVQNMTMDPLEMEGGIGSPDGMTMMGTKGPVFKPFKLVRTSFYREIVRSTERF